MTETDKEYKLRSLCSEIIDFFERVTDDFDKFCDCGLENGEHQALCTTSLIRLDIGQYQKKLSKLSEDSK